MIHRISTFRAVNGSEQYRKPDPHRHEPASDHGHELVILWRRHLMERALAPDPEPPTPDPIDAAREVGRVARQGRQAVVAAAAEAYGLTLTEIAKPTDRRQRVVTARMVAAYVLRKGCGLTLEATARALGLESHGTVTSALWRMQRRMEAAGAGEGRAA